jgi:plasmid stabilization system protein ParE
MLEEALHDVVNFPEMGIERPDLFDGAAMMPVGHHIIYYRVELEILRIVRILQESTDTFWTLPPPER